MREIFIGTAGWSIPTAHAPKFSSAGSHLERYARIFHCAEINTTFYRPHRPATWARWAESTPPDFRFSVKLPRAITHDSSLVCEREHLLPFFDQIRTLGQRLGPLLIQLPPSQSFDPLRAPAFLETIRTEYPDGPIVIEPRHPTWFSSEAEQLLCHLRIARVIVDPPICPASLTPGGDPSLVYIRLHGSPRMYYSSYDDAFLDGIASLISKHSSATAWCIFDNTAHGHATANALQLLQKIPG
ncbi:DUF72 domain-containing protein [Edaphobacter sp. HDX4]|uniref:DUF72 domain-containing protein n=1 Tax=Edaphobacter sp. HDX4 TaxID=2794064 RepID=UPI002FE6B354